MKKIDRYIIKKYIGTFVVMLGLFVPISILVDLSQKIDKFKQYEVPSEEIFGYYYDFIWFFGNLLFPIFLFLSVIWFTSKLANDTEVIAILSSGISFNRYLRPFVISASIIALFSFFTGIFVIPATSKSFNEFDFKYFNRNKKARQTDNLFKQIGASDIVYLSSYNHNRNLGYNFSYEHFEANELQYKISAQTIRWIEKDSIHRLSNFFMRTYIDDKEIIESRPRLDTLLNFKLEDLSPVEYMAQTLNFFELNDFIRLERERGSSLINHHLLVRQKRWSLPVSAFILTMIGVSVASFKRRGGMGVNLALGIILAFIYIFFDKIFEVMVEKSGFIPWIAAWLPNILFGILSIILLQHAKR